MNVYEYSAEIKSKVASQMYYGSWMLVHFH